MHYERKHDGPKLRHRGDFWNVPGSDTNLNRRTCPFMFTLHNYRHHQKSEGLIPLANNHSTSSGEASPFQIRTQCF